MTLVETPPAPVRHAHPLRAETVRGFAPLAGAAVLLTTAVVLGGSADRWQGGWAETRTELHDALLVLLPLAAAAGCRQGGRERRRRTEELWGTAVRGPLARFLVSALPLALWVAAGYLLAVAGALLATWPYARGDRPYLALLPADTVALAAAAVAGQVVGRLVTWRLAPPLLATAGFVALGVSLSARESAGRFLNPAFPVAVGEVPAGWQPVAAIGWTAGLVAAAVLAHAARRRYAALLPLAAAVAAGAVLVTAGDGPWRTNPAEGRQVCDTSTTPQICVNARYGELLPQVTAALSRVTDRLDGVRNLPVRFEDRTGEPRADEVQLPMLTPIGWSMVRGRLTDPEQYAWEAVAALQRRADCDALDPRVGLADDAVENYLAPSPAREQFDALDARGDQEERDDLERRRAARARLLAMGEEERREWLSAYFATTGSCDSTEVPAL
ncbi:hypothetical protein JCM4814A_67640 [Streptomyces phaeofaciens JCM 4814]|uniref:Uncharacterized protein n=1 Tax=Streptomyces phaeofaciens TaxID=68254 RepID=A0A918LRN5_9ACTN|nr:hypothetical protein [Streptomyces phaeofaciens]GGT40681.1 hypothetical protein GCM10010226_16290 [Streptomyces phaeofaciens]